MDDICIFSRTEKEHIEHIRLILELMAEKGMRLSPEKAQIALPELRYMGFIISFDAHGHPLLNAEKSKTEAISNLPTPKNIKACR